MKRDRQQQEILGEAVRNAFLKLDPRIQWKNPVMFIVFLGAILVAVLAVRAFMAGNTQEGWFDLHIDLWLWFTVLFANFAEAVAEGRGKAQAESLRKARKSLQAKKIKADGSFEIVGSEAIRNCRPIKILWSSSANCRIWRQKLPSPDSFSTIPP